MKDKNLTPMLQDYETEFYKLIGDLFTTVCKYAKQQSDSVVITTYYEVGRMIVELEQQRQNGYCTVL